MNKARILLVDDTETHIVAEKMMLGSSRYEFVVARSGKQALASARLLHPDLILLDVVMPDMNGLTVAELLKQDERTRHIPLVMITSAAEFTGETLTHEKGFEASLVKPLDREVLRKTVESLLPDMHYRELPVEEAPEMVATK